MRVYSEETYKKNMLFFLQTKIEIVSKKKHSNCSVKFHYQKKGKNLKEKKYSKQE